MVLKHVQLKPKDIEVFRKLLQTDNKQWSIETLYVQRGRAPRAQQKIIIAQFLIGKPPVRGQTVYGLFTLTEHLVPCYSYDDPITPSLTITCYCNQYSCFSLREAP